MELKINEKLQEAESYIERQKEYIADLENEIDLLYKRLNQIRELAWKELK